MRQPVGIVLAPVAVIPSVARLVYSSSDQPALIDGGTLRGAAHSYASSAEARPDAPSAAGSSGNHRTLFRSADRGARGPLGLESTPSGIARSHAASPTAGGRYPQDHPASRGRPVPPSATWVSPAQEASRPRVGAARGGVRSTRCSSRGGRRAAATPGACFNLPCC